jgi:hypothetical protein
MHKCRELARTGAWRKDSRASNWIGYLVADVLKINVTYGAENKKEDLVRIKQILSKWYKNKVLATEKRKDERRHEREFIIPGPWQTEPETTAPSTPTDLDLNEFDLQ